MDDDATQPRRAVCDFGFLKALAAGNEADKEMGINLVMVDTAGGLVEEPPSDSKSDTSEEYEAVGVAGFSLQDALAGKDCLAAEKRPERDGEASTVAVGESVQE